MKKFIAFLLFALVLLPSVAHAALSTNGVWEIRTLGADTNGGGFVPAVTSKSSATDLAIAAGSNLQVSSTTYGFTSADNGRYFTITSGTGFNLGLFQVISVAGGTATINLPAGTVSSTAGHFTMYYGLDYSQQNAANVNGGSNGSSVLGSYVSGTTITCTDCQFTNDIDGNIVYVAGGTGSITAGWYQATYGSATTITVDRSTGLAAGTGITVKIGGALATPAKVAALYAAGNQMWFRNDGTYTTTVTITFSTGANPAFNLPWTRIRSYTTTRGDGGRATIQASTSTNFAVLTISGPGVWVDGLIVDAHSLTGVTGITNTSTEFAQISNNKIINYGQYGFVDSASNFSVFPIVFYNEFSGGVSGAIAAISIIGGGAHNNYVHDGVGVGIIGSNYAMITYNVVYNMTGATADCIRTGYSGIIYGNIAYSCGRNGINGAQGANSFGSPLINSNILVNNSAYGLSVASSPGGSASQFYDGNAFFGNISGTRNNSDDRGATNIVNGIVPYTNVHDVILTGDPFVSASTGNFSLNATGGAGGSLKATSLPSAWPGLGSTTGYPSFGAVQPQINGGSAGGSYSFVQ